MCGIIGYTGSENALPKMTEGLSVLEYRGYDSVGIAAQNEDGITVVKCRGRIGELKEKSEMRELVAECAIGHTRWATHGGPSDTNAHPHRAGRVVLVHNGIIENYKELKEDLAEKGIGFLSETDTEIAAAVLNACYDAKNEPIEAIRAAMKKLKGSYAFGILFDDRAGEVYAVRCGSPLILAKGSDGYYLASDMTALLPFTKEYHSLTEGQIACLTASSAMLYKRTGEAIIPEWSVTNLSAESAQKGGYAHFMLKEIHEQPEAIVKSVSSRIKNGLPDFSGDGIDADFWKRIKNIQIVACGSAMHAGLVGARLLEQYAKVPTSVHIASEYRYHPPLASEGTLVIVISQSGETADSLAALRYAKSVGLPTLGIVNAVETTIAREADHRIYTYAGPEIAVATTKGYCTQVSVLYMIAAAIAYTCGRMTESNIKDLVYSIAVASPRAVDRMLKRCGAQYRQLAQKLAKCEHAFYIGRGLDYALSMEGSLKLKEISYIHTEAYAAGELKHGTISLIEEGTPVIAISTEAAILDKTESNVREVVSRGADVILICREDAIDA
ncbi:MAG: glutamine--fructose-6-phosphate transaminase (isomerizing), partial [Clostridia bacterium]|nr:glutamine--fructose-6-phosphate transaminase (isomerizing) [Clostridia bacterium]